MKLTNTVLFSFCAVMIFMSSSFAAAGNYSGAKVTGIKMSNYSSSSAGDLTIYLNKSDGTSLGTFLVKSSVVSPDAWKSLLSVAMFAYQNNSPVDVYWDTYNYITQLYPHN